MAARITGNFADMADIATKLTTAETESVSRRAQNNTEMVTFIEQTDGVAEAAATQFGTSAEALMGELKQAQASIGAADFEGDAAVAAAGAEEHFRGRIDTCQINCEGALQTLKTNLKSSLESFKAELDTEYGGLLTEMSAEYQKLSKGTTDLAAHYLEGDASIKFA